jgi:hypothetical protein
MIHKLLCGCCREELYHGVDSMGSRLEPAGTGREVRCLRGESRVFSIPAGVVGSPFSWVVATLASAIVVASADPLVR